MREGTLMVISEAIHNEISYIHRNEKINVYKKNEFCKHVRCEYLEEKGGSSHCSTNKCIHTAKEFHRFLSDNDKLLEEKKIVKEKEKIIKEIIAMVTGKIE